MNFLYSQTKRGIRIVASRLELWPFLIHLIYRFRIHTNKSLRPEHPESEAIDSLVSVLEDGDIFWDVGAMNGSYTRYVRAAIQPKAIHAFEPNPIYFESCQQNLYSLPGTFIRKTHDVALSDESGLMYFVTEMPAEANTSAGAIVKKSKIDKFDNEKIVEVSMITGDKIIQNNEALTPSILKIDVEGAEMAVLRGLSDTFSSGEVRAALCEIHLPVEGPSPSIEDFDYTAEDVHRFFEEHGYSVQKVCQRERDYHILAIQN